MRAIQITRNPAQILALLSLAALLLPAAVIAQDQPRSLLEPLPERTAAAAPAAQQPQTTTAPAATTAASNSQLSQLFYQLQVLQQEVQELRGLVEEQSYQLNRLAQDQKEQYIDLDGRIAGLTGAVGPTRPGMNGSTLPGTTGTGPGAVQAPTSSAGSATTGAAPLVPPAGAGTRSSSAVTASGSLAGMSERDAYSRAFDLMKARQFEESTAAFNQLIVAYPNGQYTPNAFYWLGELYLAQTETEQARQAFAQVLNLYPDHPKVPDTLYKMGVVYHRLGDNGKATEYFEQVVVEHPNSSAAGLATRYMAELQ